jgi:hypothetical protein
MYEKIVYVCKVDGGYIVSNKVPKEGILTKRDYSAYDDGDAYELLEYKADVVEIIKIIVLGTFIENVIVSVGMRFGDIAHKMIAYSVHFIVMNEIDKPCRFQDIPSIANVTHSFGDMYSSMGIETECYSIARNLNLDEILLARYKDINPTA